MEIKDLSLKMKEEARSLGLCDKWYDNWGDASINDMLAMLKKGFDFYIKNRYKWFTPAFLKEEVGVNKLRKENILANDKWSLTNPSECFLLGESDTFLRCNGNTVCKAWMLGKSTMTVSAKGMSHIVIEAFDNATITLDERHPSSRIVIIVHSQLVNVITNGKVDAVIKYAKDFV